jgi:hypothetical protein
MLLHGKKDCGSENQPVRPTVLSELEIQYE